MLQLLFPGDSSDFLFNRIGAEDQKVMPLKNIMVKSGDRTW